GTISASLTDSGHMFTPEGTANTGTINIRSNMHLGNNKAAENSISGSSSGGAQTIAYSDYNNFYTVTVPYTAGAQLTITAGNTTKAVPGSHDTANNPQFFGQTRNISTWNALFGSGTATQAAAITYFLGLNGYRGTPNFDQQGTATVYTPGNALDWVAYGYSPTNLVFRGAGDPGDGTNDTGAMPVRSPAGFF